MLLFTILLIVFRVYYSKDLIFAGLGLNLVLAFIPFFLSSVVLFSSDKKVKSVLGIVILILWLMFFPNAPYLITDFVHLKPRANIPFWFDTILMFSAALNGLFLAFISLYDIEKKIRESFSNLFTNFFILFALFLGSFGIYLGRFLRYSSWDIIGKPFQIYNDAINIFSSPIDNLNVFGFMALFTCFLFIVYFFFRGIANVSFLNRY